MRDSATVAVVRSEEMWAYTSAAVDRVMVLHDREVVVGKEMKARWANNQHWNEHAGIEAARAQKATVARRRCWHT